MIIVRVTGGIGNQMFQYAFGRALAERHKTEVKLDISFYSDPKWNVPPRTYDLDIFNIHEKFATQEETSKLSKRLNFDIGDRILNRMFGVKRTHIREPHIHFSEIAFSSPDNVYISGYWQSEKYFVQIEPLLRREFTFREPPSANAEKILSRIGSTNSVCVHVRRGDFLTNPLNGVYGTDYFKDAEKVILRNVSDPTYFVFSDDMEWCESNLRFEGPTVFVSDDFGERKFRDDLRLMSNCKHFVIPNSSFSWWAVWLSNRTGNIVIAPKRWLTDPTIDTSDLIPKAWIRL
jgi:hypothetical protein